MGHSSGEIAAAYASHVISASAAIIVAYYRGQVTRKSSRSGGMTAVGMARELVTPYLSRGVAIACENSPSSVTLSGNKKTLNSVVAKISAENPEVFVRHLKVDMAYHSRKCSMTAVPKTVFSIDVLNTDECQIICKRWVRTIKRY